MARQSDHASGMAFDYRPSASPALFRQMVGRRLRPVQEERVVTLLDEVLYRQARRLGLNIALSTIVAQRAAIRVKLAEPLAEGLPEPYEGRDGHEHR